MVQIKRSNPNAFKQLDLRLRELQSKQGKVGWFESARYENGMPVAAIAAQNELGNPAKNIPPRPTMRPALIENQDRIRDIAASGAKQIIAGKATPAGVMETLTLFVEGEVSRNIATITEPPLSPKTLAARKRKGNNSAKPLVDTGLELATLTSVVEDAGTV